MQGFTQAEITYMFRVGIRQLVGKRSGEMLGHVALGGSTNR